MPDLRISDISSGVTGNGRRIEVEWQDGSARRTAVASIDGAQDDQAGDLVRWYLEDYAEFPAEPGPTLAANAEALLARDGADLFRRVFSSPDTAGIWERARDRLGDVRVEINADPSEGPGLAWELLRDPSTDSAVALGAKAFVRTHLLAAGHPDQPEPSGDRLRVLLVICRPGGGDDVPFRSVASRLVRGGAELMKRLDLDVLRPATFARLAQVLRGAKAAGRPYHVVHFDGHGTYLDVADLGLDQANDGTGTGGGGFDVSPVRYGISVAGPTRPGQHGYLLFEAPGGARSPGAGNGMENVQLVDGPTLGRLLTETGVPVLALNACRSAYAEARSQPAGQAESPERGARSPETAAGEDPLAGDVHARIRAYGSLAAEVADVGVPGVVAMRYNVYVVTAAQFMADLYAHLLSGRSLGEAVATARRGLAADPNRQIGSAPVALQDWAVPVVYESAPLVLLRPGDRRVPVVRLTSGDAASAAARSGSPIGGESPGMGPDGLPRPPDAGFFGRDETLLALDRAFDAQRLVLLHAFAGAGKSSTVAEFARWYQATGGLGDPEHPDRGAGPTLWSSFEHHLTADRAIGMVGDHFAELLEANGIAWSAVTDPGQRRGYVLQILAQIPVLWVWDNVEPVAGFPAGTPSLWTAAERAELADLLRDLSTQTKCKVLLTSRRDEYAWLGDLPARVRLPRMPMRESLQLAAAIAERRGHSITGAGWRPLLRFAAGNPLTITVVTGQALRENLSTAEDIGGFVRRLEAGETQLEAGEDVALGRTRSLAASLDYGFAHAFTDAERAQLAVLHLFRGTVDVDALLLMGNPDACGDDALPELAGLDADIGTALLDRAAEVGLLSSLGDAYYQIHPALPWYFHALFTDVYGRMGERAARRATRAYVRAMGELGNVYIRNYESGLANQTLPALRAEEANLQNALDLARAERVWLAAAGCVQGLHILYERTGRDSEWARLLADVFPDFTDTATGGPPPDREAPWSIVTRSRARLARDSRDWRTATELLNALATWHRDEATEAVGRPAAELTSRQRNAIRTYAVDLCDLGDTLVMQDDPGCLPYYQEALALNQQIGDRAREAQDAGSLGNVYILVHELRDLDQAERWFRHSLALRAESDRRGRAMNLGSLADLALERFDDALNGGEAAPTLLQHLNAALHGYQDSLDLIPADDHEVRGGTEDQIGKVYSRAGDVASALRHFRQAIRHSEARGDFYGAGVTRYNTAVLLFEHGRVSEALPYALAALNNFRQAGPGVATEAVAAEGLIAELKQHQA